jgi:hypothetical protein
VRRWSPSGHGARSNSSSLEPPSSVGHSLSTGRMRGGTSMLADHLLPVEDLHGVGELHVPWTGNTLDLVLWGLGDAQLEQQTAKLCGSSR